MAAKCCVACEYIASEGPAHEGGEEAIVASEEDCSASTMASTGASEKAVLFDKIDNSGKVGVGKREKSGDVPTCETNNLEHKSASVKETVPAKVPTGEEDRTEDDRGVVDEGENGGGGCTTTTATIAEVGEGSTKRRRSTGVGIVGNLTRSTLDLKVSTSTVVSRIWYGGSHSDVPIEFVWTRYKQNQELCCFRVCYFGDPSDESGITLDKVTGEIELRHIRFKYPTRPDVRQDSDIAWREWK
ncbi:hypothetical protein LXL04_023351 [Taraxacum kok-saghyz]